MAVVRLTVIIQGEVVLGVAEFLRPACDEDVIIPKEILEAGNLWGQQREDLSLSNLAAWQESTAMQSALWGWTFSLS